MNRTATCSCEQLEISFTGNPCITNVCCCTLCQRRTGSAFGMGAYFKEVQLLDIKGESEIFNQVSEAQKNVERCFCGRCGTTLYWKAEFQPNLIGVAVGCFNDPSFPEPRIAVWNCSKFDWLEFPKHWKSLDKQSFD